VFNGIGPPELLIVLVIVLVIFGPKRLPGLGRSLGSGMREFKDSITGKTRDDDDDDDSRDSGGRPTPRSAARTRTPHPSTVRSSPSARAASAPGST
jgi:sec-independent protein translocase protein TatA